MNELQVSHLEVHYGDLIGVADVSLRVEEGAIVALLGSIPPPARASGSDR